MIIYFYNYYLTNNDTHFVCQNQLILIYHLYSSQCFMPQNANHIMEILNTSICRLYAIDHFYGTKNCFPEMHNGHGAVRDIKINNHYVPIPKDNFFVRFHYLQALDIWDCI